MKKNKDVLTRSSHMDCILALDTTLEMAENGNMNKKIE